MPTDNDWKTRLQDALNSSSASTGQEGVIYSTNPDYNYHDPLPDEPETLAPSAQPLRLSIQRKGRGGKTVTVVSGFCGKEKDLLALAKLLKNRCGIGGSVKDGLIILQGDKRTDALAYLKELGYKQAR